jgi:hypothetical protein
MRNIARLFGWFVQGVGWFALCLAVIAVAAAAKGIRPYIGTDQTSLIVDLMSPDGHRGGARHYTILYCNYLTLHGIKTRALTSAPDQPLDHGCDWYERAPGMPASMRNSYFQEW